MYTLKRFNRYTALHVLIGAASLFLFCSPMKPMAPFERIESSRIRPVGMVILPYPEGAPGNILSVRAFFAGKPIVDFTDFRVCKGEFDTVGTPVSIIGPSHSASDELDFEYRLPDTMLDSVIERLQKSPEYVPEFNPLITALKTNKLEMLQNLDSSQTAAVEGFLNALYLKCRFMFTVSTADGEELKIRKDFMVRYNCRLQDIPGISRRLPVNNNPVIESIALCKVTGDTSDFDPIKLGRPYSGHYLQLPAEDSATVNDTIEIDTGCSYFLSAYNPIVDTYLIPYPVKNDPSQVQDSLVAEKFSWTWFFEQYGGSPTEDNGMTLQEGEVKATIQLFPPLDLSVSGCTVWVKVSDYLDSKAPRPTGTAQKSVKCVFKYTDAYRRAMGQ